MIIKFCGLTRLKDVEVANQLHPDLVGFVFAPNSKRHVSPEQAAVLRQHLDPSIRTVGVFVGEEPALMEDLVRQGTIDLIQLHGNQPEALIPRLQKSAPVIRAFRIREAADLAPALASPADMVLLDAGAGDGTVFDWTLLESFDRPYLLAGGLTPENAGTAARLHPAGLDVSSGIETEGHKDPEKMAAFMAAVKGAA